MTAAKKDLFRRDEPISPYPQDKGRKEKDLYFENQRLSRQLAKVFHCQSPAK
jgi:hypothetical protein